MTVQPISPRSAALTFSPEELPGDTALLLPLVRDALSRAGLSLPAPLELEVYPGGKELLLLVRSLPPSPRPLPVRACRHGRIRRT